MASAMPNNGLPSGQQDQDAPLILGAGDEQAGSHQNRSTSQTNPSQANPDPANPGLEDLAAPVPPSSPELPKADSPADLKLELASLRAQMSRILAMEGQLQQLLQSSQEQAPPAARPSTIPGWLALLLSLVAGMVGGGLVMTLLLWLSAPRPIAQAPGPREASRPEPSGAASSAAAPSRPAGARSADARAQQTLQLRCDQPCWLDVRTANTGQQVYYKLLKGTVNLPLGSGLDVFSGRADLVKLRINDGPEQPFLPGRVVGGRVIAPRQASQPES